MVEVKYHNVDIHPPDNGRAFVISCSEGDLNRECSTQAEAKEIAFGHVFELATKARDQEALRTIEQRALQSECDSVPTD